MLGLGSSTQLGIGIAITLQNRFSGEAKRVNDSLLAMKKNANSAVLTAMGNYQRTATMVAAGAGAVVYGLYNMAKSGAEFQHKINQAFIVGGENLGKTRAQLSQFAMDLSGKFATTPMEIAGALFENTKAGITKGLEEITQYQIMAATAAGEQLDGPGGVAQTLLGIMNSMDISTDKFKDVANGVTGAANATMASVTDIGKAMEYTAFAAKLYNVPLAETLAMTGKLSQSNIRGSAAGTGMANMFRQLSQTLGPMASKKSHTAWSLIGLDENEMRSLANTGQIYKVVEAIQEATKTMKPIEAMGLINPLFNNRGGRAVQALFTPDPKTGNKGYNQILKETNQAIAGDAARKQSEAMMNDLWGDFKLLGNAFDRLKAAIGKNEMIRSFVGVMTKLVSAFAKLANTKLGGFLVALTTISAVVIGLTAAFRAIALAATSTLISMSRMNSVGGFRGLMGAGMGMIGAPGLGAAARNMAYNSAGRLYATAPTTFNGMSYKSGQLVSGAMAGAMGMNLMGTPGAAAMGRGALGFFGKAGPWLGRIAGVGLKAVPILGGILTAVSVVSMIYDFLKGDKAEKEAEKPKIDPMLSEYYRSLDLQYGQLDMAKYNKTLGDSSNNPNGPNKLSQTININLDGRQAVTQSVENTLDKDIDNYIKFTLPE